MFFTSLSLSLSLSRNVDTTEQYHALNASLIGAALQETSVSLHTVAAILKSAAAAT